MGLAYFQHASAMRRPNCHRIVFLAPHKTSIFRIKAFDPIGQNPSKTAFLVGARKTVFGGQKTSIQAFRGGSPLTAILRMVKK